MNADSAKDFLRCQQYYERGVKIEKILKLKSGRVRKQKKSEPKK